MNSARFGADWAPYTGSMAVKGFSRFEAPDPGSPDAVKSLLRSAIVSSYPKLRWRFSEGSYEPYRFAYDKDGVLRNFDYESDLVVEQVSPPVETFWGFVEHECEQDETSPQIFGEALRCRFMMSSRGSVFLRFTFNHALADGLTIFRFLEACERALQVRNVQLPGLALEDGRTIRRWETGRTRYSVEDMLVQEHGPSRGRESDYLRILYQMTRRRPLTRIRHAVANPKNARIQLAIAPVHKAVRYDRFRRLNEAEIKRAEQGTYLSDLLESYRNDPAGGDRVVRQLMSVPLVGPYLASLKAGELLISSFMFKHDRYLAFPVVHALQREGAAICNVWQTESGLTARITRVRQLASPRRGDQVLKLSGDSRA